MKYEEISNLIQFKENFESNLFMPNEIFEDLKANIKNTPHIAFAYSYIYLCTFNYRYAKHFSKGEIIDNAKAKELLGYDPKNRTLNYLIKKGGLLDEMEYLESTRDYPVSWEYSKMNAEDIQFTLSSEFGDIKGYLPEIPKRFFLKYPVKGFTRILEEDGEEFETIGTFYEVDNTHNIPFEVFLYCMSNEDIGCTGFYLYAYLKHKNDLFEGGFDVSLQNLSSDTGISETGIDRYLGALKGYKLVDFIHNQEFFAIGMRKEDRKANTYITNKHCMFNDIHIPFNKIEIMKKKEYFEMLKSQREPVNRADFDVNELPF
ncbi:hypothetical protein V6B14_08535 [Sporosarcina psychrophila]|uniref:hypothetical protein n=1 Tax=Sporosarcina psychrophila TaxID=1476 RepID=UPI0030CF58A9